MSAQTISPNMNLVIPVAGEETGPQWSVDLNASLSIIDSHTHSSGSGVQINPSGININADLPFGGNNATNLRSVRLASQPSVLAGGSDLGCLSNVLGDLYFNDGSGNKVRITQSGGVAGASGTITGLVSPASAAYNAGSSTFIFQSGANIPANLDGGAIVLRNIVASSKGLTLSPPPAMGANFGIVLPSLPGSTSFLTIDGTGNMGASIPTSGGITGSNLASNLNLSGTSNLVDSLYPIAQGYGFVSSPVIVTGIVQGTTGTIFAGSAALFGATVVRNGPGDYNISFPNSTVDIPILTVSHYNLFNGIPLGVIDIASIPLTPSGAFRIFMQDGTSPATLLDSSWTFIAIYSR